jgi:hypothetical protein
MILPWTEATAAGCATKQEPMSTRTHASITLEGLYLNGIEFSTPMPVANYVAAIGTSTRIIDAGAPAPVGHRNNQIHLYDGIGIYLNEHHATGLIQALTFILWLEEATFPTRQTFDGDLVVGGVCVGPGMREGVLAASTIRFHETIAGQWSAKEGGIYVGAKTIGRRGNSGRRSKVRLLVDVSICFS